MVANGGGWGSGLDEMPGMLRNGGRDAAKEGDFLSFSSGVVTLAMIHQVAEPRRLRCRACGEEFLRRTVMSWICWAMLWVVERLVVVSVGLAILAGLVMLVWQRLR